MTTRALSAKGDPKSLLEAAVNVGINKACSLQNKCIQYSYNFVATDCVYDYNFLSISPDLNLIVLIMHNAKNDY